MRRFVAVLMRGAFDEVVAVKAVISAAQLDCRANPEIVDCFGNQPVVAGADAAKAGRALTDTATAS